MTGDTLKVDCHGDEAAITVDEFDGHVNVNIAHAFTPPEGASAAMTPAQARHVAARLLARADAIEAAR